LWKKDPSRGKNLQKHSGLFTDRTAGFTGPKLWGAGSRFLDGGPGVLRRAVGGGDLPGPGPNWGGAARRAWGTKKKKKTFRAGGARAAVGGGGGGGNGAVRGRAPAGGPRPLITSAGLIAGRISGRFSGMRMGPRRGGNPGRWGGGEPRGFFRALTFQAFLNGGAFRFGSGPGAAAVGENRLKPGGLILRILFGGRGEKKRSGMLGRPGIGFSDAHFHAPTGGGKSGGGETGR